MIRTSVSKWSLAAVLAAILVSPAALRAATVDVSMVDNSFNPSTVTVCVGDTVRWTNNGNNPHTSTSGSPCGMPSGTWDSGMLNTGQSFQRVFNSPGDFDYFCNLHCPTMTGTVSVVTGPSAGLSLSVNKLRTSHDPVEGRGGTVKGVESFSGGGAEDVLPDTVEVTLTLTGTFQSSGLPFSATGTAQVPTSRPGTHVGRYSDNASQDLVITGATIRGTSDPEVSKYSIGYVTHGIDLSDVVPGSLNLQVEMLQTMDSSCGIADVLASASGPVQN